MSVVVEIPMKLPSVANSGYKTEHWAVKAKRVKAQRQAVAMVLQSARVLDRIEEANGAACVVTLVRGGPRMLDDDNLAYAFKAVRDEVAKYLGVNDNDPRIAWRYSQSREKSPCVRIYFAVVGT